MILRFKSLYSSQPEYNDKYTIKSDSFEQKIKVYIESEPKLECGFYEYEAGLYEIPWTYIGLQDVITCLDDIFPEDVNIINSYIKVFEEGYQDKDVFGFLLPEYFRDKSNIPQRVMSDLFLVSPRRVEDLELQTTIKPSNLRYRKQDLVLPEVIKNYKVYKVPGKYLYLGEDDYNNDNYYDYITTEKLRTPS